MYPNEKFIPPAPALPGDKPLPQVPEAEKALIGSVLVNPEAMAFLAGLVQPSDFFNSENQKLWEACSMMFERGNVITPPAIATILKNSGELEQAGGFKYIAALVSLSVGMDSCEIYAQQVRDCATRRRMITAAYEIVAEGYAGVHETDDFLSRAEAKIIAVTDVQASNEVLSIGTVATEKLEKLEEIKRSGNSTSGVPSGLDALDQILNGFRKSCLILIAGRPGSGKSGIAANICVNAARNQYHVLFASLEMSNEQQIERMYSILTGIDGSRIQTVKYISRDQFDALSRACDTLQRIPLFIDDTSKMTTMELYAKCRRMRAQGRLDLVVVDYLQIMTPSDKRLPREQQVSGIGRDLKMIAKKLDIPVIALTQLNRKTEDRAGLDKRPQLADLRESGSLEQESDVVIGLYRPDYYKKEGDKTKKPETLNQEETTNRIDIDILKHRQGACGIVKGNFNPATMTLGPWKPEDNDIRADMSWQQK